MAAGPVDTPGRGVSGLHRGAGPRLRSVARGGAARAARIDPDRRYRFDVVGMDVPDVVRAAGGWLYDRVMAGWDVTVLISGEVDTRPLQILGARTLDLVSVLTQWELRPHPQTIAVSAQMLATHDVVHHGVRQALTHGGTEVTLWGAVPSELDPDVDIRQHRLSAAARAFKTQALIAAGVDPAVDDIETFRCGLLACPSVAADLSPAS